MNIIKETDNLIIQAKNEDNFYPITKKDIKSDLAAKLVKSLNRVGADYDMPNVKVAQKIIALLKSGKLDGIRMSKDGDYFYAYSGKNIMDPGDLSDIL